LYLAHSKRDPASPSRLSDLYCLPFSACSDDKTDNKTDNTDWVRMYLPTALFVRCLIALYYILPHGSGTGSTGESQIIRKRCESRDRRQAPSLTCPHRVPGPFGVNLFFAESADSRNLKESR
jgi:hypothetical protein